MAPIHEGTIKYFKEIDLWKNEDDVRQLYNIKLIDWYCEAWEQTLLEADQQGLSAFSPTEDWLILWQEKKAELAIPIFKQMTNDEILNGIDKLKKVGH